MSSIAPGIGQLTVAPAVGACVASRPPEGGLVLSGKNPVVIAAALGLLAGGTAWSAMRARERAARERWRTVYVLCAKIDVKEGAELAPEMIAVREMPAAFVTDSFIQADEEGT